MLKERPVSSVFPLTGCFYPEVPTVADINCVCNHGPAAHATSIHPSADLDQKAWSASGKPGDTFRKKHPPTRGGAARLLSTSRLARCARPVFEPHNTAATVIVNHHKGCCGCHMLSNNQTHDPAHEEGP